MERQDVVNPRAKRIPRSKMASGNEEGTPSFNGEKMGKTAYRLKKGTGTYDRPKPPG